MACISSWDLTTVKLDLLKANNECSQRGLIHSATWASELYFALSDIKVCLLSETNPTHSKEWDSLEWDRYLLARNYFSLQEYDRAAYFTENCTSPKARFLHFYSFYCSGEKKKLDDMAEIAIPVDKAKNAALKKLRRDLQIHQLKNSLDGYCLYLYGLVLKSLQLHKQAVEMLCEAIHKEPLLWGSWLELAALITDREMFVLPLRTDLRKSECCVTAVKEDTMKNALNALLLPDHWMKDFFLAHTYLELQLNEEALDIYTRLSKIGFSCSTYIMAQVAIAYHNMRDLDKAIDGFQALQKVDPYRLDNMDIFSNLLYVKEMRVELSHLAHNTCDIDKYRVETCVVIGNFYSLRSQHEKAVLYFQRALKLNPNYLAAWTLMGHEYMEMKNTSFAIQSYRQAIEVNRRDYRAWYGLGQTYEILKMPFYCLYYYRQAQQLRPHDSRMMVALGEAYEKLDKLAEAKKCFWRAHAVGDVEGMALMRLAKLYEKLNEEDQAAAAYNDYIRDGEARGATDRDEQCHAYLYLAKYYFKRLKLEEAYENAQKSTEYPETKEEAKGLLKQIAHRRAHDSEAMQVEDGGKGGPSQFGIASVPLGHLSPMNLAFTP